MDSNKKMLLIGGGVLAAAGAIYLLTRPKAAAAQGVAASSPTLPTGQSSVYGGGSLTPSQVQCVQQALATAGFPPKGGADGQWGANTSAALTAYMKARGVASDGTFNADAAASPLGACLQTFTPSQAPSTATSAPATVTVPPPSPQLVPSIQLTTYPRTIYASCTNGQTDTDTDKTIRDWLDNDCHFNNLMTVAKELRAQGCTELSDYAIKNYSEMLTNS